MTPWRRVLLALVATALMAGAPPYAGPDPVDTPTVEGLPAIASNFDRATQIERDPDPVAKSADPDGAFRFICQPGQLNWDDPIVYPGQVGGSPHLHQWFGNSLGNANSTYRSLRTAGESSCMGPLNRSAYWMPAMMDGKGGVVRPDYIAIYYKRLPSSAPKCGPGGQNCRELPRGLRYIFGFDMLRMHDRQPENVLFHWKCVTPQDQMRGGQDVRFDRLDCPPGNAMMVSLSSPDCWDGKRLDSPNHRSHVVDQVRDVNTGQPSCPKTHPIMLPQFTLIAAYKVAAGERVQDWHLSSDRMAGMPVMPPGSTFHADWYGAWDDETLRTWTANCIEHVLSCSAGELGDGTIMRRPPGYGLTANPRIVPVPTRPTTAR